MISFKHTVDRARRFYVIYICRAVVVKTEEKEALVPRLAESGKSGRSDSSESTVKRKKLYIRTVPQEMVNTIEDI